MQFNRSKNPNLPLSPSSHNGQRDSHSSRSKNPFEDQNNRQSQVFQQSYSMNSPTNVFNNGKKSKTMITNLGLNNGSSFGNINNENISSGIQNGGLFNRQQCHKLAKTIIGTYDGNQDGSCDTLQVAKWLVDCYRAMNKTFQPTATDIASFMHIIDRQRTGKISLDDLENFIAKMFYNPNRD